MAKKKKRRRLTPEERRKLADYVSVRQFALKFGLAQSTVLEHIKQENIPAVRIGKLYRIPKVFVERLEREGLGDLL